MGRTKIPEEIQAELLFKSNRQCCVCDNHKRGDHIHHIDGRNSNNILDNLAFLCFDCHNEASLKGSLRKKLLPKAIIKFRDHHYQVIANKRKKSLETFNTTVEKLTSEELLEISKNAIIILELEKIKEEYYNLDWSKRADLLEKINKYCEHTNFRIAFSLFDFISLVAYQTSTGMKLDTAHSIFGLIICFFPNRQDSQENKKIIELSNKCINIATDMTFDALFYLKDFEVAQFGLNVLKFIHQKGKQLKIKELQDKVLNTYNELEELLKNKESDNFELCQSLFRIYKEDFKYSTLALPPLNKEIEEYIKKNKRY